MTAILLAYDCWGLLETEEVARIAWLGHDGVAIVPVNYVVADGSLWLRTDPYSELGRESPGSRVALEVDHVERPDHWGWSVVVVGTAEKVDVIDVPDPVMDMRVWPSEPRGLFLRIWPIVVTGRRL